MRRHFPQRQRSGRPVKIYRVTRGGPAISHERRAKRDNVVGHHGKAGRQDKSAGHLGGEEGCRLNPLDTTVFVLLSDCVFPSWTIGMCDFFASVQSLDSNLCQFTPVCQHFWKLGIEKHRILPTEIVSGVDSYPYWWHCVGHSNFPEIVVRAFRRHCGMPPLLSANGLIN